MYVCLTPGVGITGERAFPAHRVGTGDQSLRQQPVLYLLSRLSSPTVTIFKCMVHLLLKKSIFLPMSRGSFHLVTLEVLLREGGWALNSGSGLKPRFLVSEGG